MLKIFYLLFRSRVGSDRYWLIFIIVAFTVIITHVVQRNLGMEPRRSIQDELFSKPDVLLPSGAHISFEARTDVQEHLKRSFFENPEKPDNYWVNPEKYAAAGVGSSGKSIDQSQADYKKRESINY